MTDAPAPPRFCRDCRWARPYVAHWFAKPDHAHARCANHGVNREWTAYLVSGPDDRDGMIFALTGRATEYHCGIEGKFWEGKA